MAGENEGGEKQGYIEEDFTSFALTGIFVSVSDQVKKFVKVEDQKSNK